MKTSFLFFMLFTLLAFFQCSSPAQQSTYSIVGTWKLVDMQFEGKGKKQDMNKTLAQDQTRFVYDESGQFTMVLGQDGRGLQGGYFYNPETSVLSIIYGAHTDTALVSWVNLNKMIHTSKDGKTRTVLERIID